ncbi:MAG: rRNA maturation RNase YbeY, partial [Tepidisphaeraceae bacterium]
PPPSPRSTGKRELSLSISAPVGRAYVPFLRTRLRRAHAILSPALCELSVALVNDARMSQLHQQFMSLPGPTDVLTFELDHDAKGNVTAGEVVVCVPEARRQARSRGIELRMELLLYALHGMLHLCGFDDRTDRDFRTMHRREDDILTQLGFQPVFAASPAPKPRPRRRIGAR